MLKAAASPERQAREALFLTFNIDVGFFETRLLGACRAAGAAVTVVADAYVYALDPRSARAAGQTYALGLAAAPGAFHPKLSVLAGPERALIGIGSGNITVSGWHRSEEISLIIDAETRACPRIVDDLANWLDRLPAAVTMGSTVAEGVRRTAGQLRRLVANSTVVDTGHALVSSTSGAVIDQLPAQRLRLLKAYAPFHDVNGTALRAMCRRWKPDAVQVAVQPGVTVIAPEALAAVAAFEGTKLTFHHCEIEPYRHGKLIEAVREDGTQWSLTGSPNLTAAGLLGRLPSTGNCELGVVTEGGSALFPGTGAPMAAESVPTVLRLGPDDPAHSAVSRSGPVLLAATLLMGGILRLEFARSLDRPVAVQVSDFGSLPEEYRGLGDLPMGVAQHDLQVADVDAGARVSIWWMNMDGPKWGPDLPVVDPDRVTQRVRPSHGSRANADADPLDLFQDPQLASAWLNRMNELITTAPGVPHATGAARVPGPSETEADPAARRSLEDPDTWLRYSDDARTRLGSMMVDFALGGLPRIANPPEPTSDIPIWVDRLSDDADQFDDEHTAEEQDSAGPSEVPARSARSLAAHEKARYRRWLHDLTVTASDTQAIDRLARAGLVLLGSRMQIWDSSLGSNGWFHLLADAIRTLPGDDLPPTLTPQTAALTAVALYRLDHAAPADRRSTEAKLVRTLVEDSRDLLRSAERDGVDANSQSLRVGLEPPVEGSAVWDHLTSLLHDELSSATLRELERAFPDHEITHLHGNVYRVEGSFPNPVKAGGDILDQLDNTNIAAVVASNGALTATLVKNANRLTIVRSGDGPRTYASFRLAPLNSIPGLAAGGETAQRYRLKLGPLQRLSREAAEDLEAAGLE